ncbi:MAG TPA: Na/Pi symporter [Saprospiraceae bacterium]|mgnify:CR=1 FL=1|nr:Na/Pi symporter [Saprospiraceae bacterium]
MDGWNEIQIWPLLAGLGLFLFGMYMLEEALKKLAGRSFKIFLRKQTKNRIKAILSGTLVTAILQSSSMVILLVMSFAGAGIIGLKNGIGMVLGTNLGTTFTGWMVSMIGFKLNIESVILPFLAIGGLGTIFLKSEKLSHWSKLLMGFSFMFFGLSYMKNGFAEFAEQINIEFFAGKPLILFFFAGYILTAAIQSSSASIMIFLSSLAAGIITLEQGAFLVIGADLGTTITAIIGSIGANSIKKKIGWAQFLFNLFNAVIALLLYKGYLTLIESGLKIRDPLIALVVFHSMLNLAGIVIFTPFLGQFAKVLNRMIRVKQIQVSTYVGHAISHEVHAGVEALIKEIQLFFNHALNINRAHFHGNTRNNAFPSLMDYQNLKAYEEELGNFYIQLQQNEMIMEEVEKINACISSIRNATLSAKDVKDIRHNLIELSLVTDDHLFHFYLRICENQKSIYEHLLDFSDHEEKWNEAELDKISIMSHHFYENEMKEIYSLFANGKPREVSMPTLMNVIRRISGSNDYLIRSKRLWLKAQEGVREQAHILQVLD